MRVFFLLLCLLLSAAAGPAVARPQPTILILGDSLSAAYGLATQEGWVSLLERRLRENGHPHRVVNASISGETTSGGLSRLPQALVQFEPDVIVIELGANDGLRGITLDEMQDNLAQMIALCQSMNAKVLLLGMQLPPNYGPAYTERFHAAFSQVADQTKVPLVPFFLDGVALDKGLMQADGLHPTAGAQPRLLDNVWPSLKPLL